MEWATLIRTQTFSAPTLSRFDKASWSTLRIECLYDLNLNKQLARTFHPIYNEVTVGGDLNLNRWILLIYYSVHAYQLPLFSGYTGLQKMHYLPFYFNLGLSFSLFFPIHDTQLLKTILSLSHCPQLSRLTFSALPSHCVFWNFCFKRFLN